jgi:hypothetical protein
MSIGNNTAGLQRILQAVNDLPEAAPPGVTVQRKTGTFKSGYGRVTVNCGFKPDLVTVYIGQAYDEDEGNYEGNMTVCFAEKKLNLSTLANMVFSSSGFVECMWVSQTDTGFTITSGGYDEDYKWNDRNGVSYSYTAVKYT